MCSTKKKDNIYRLYLEAHQNLTRDLSSSFEKDRKKKVTDFKGQAIM